MFTLNVVNVEQESLATPKTQLFFAAKTQAVVNLIL